MTAAKIIAAIAAMISTPTDSADLASTAPECLTSSSAGGHLAAARLAGEVYSVDPAILLSIAHHESRYQVGVTTREPLGKTSCGVMTPVPRRTCAPGGLVVGYLDGAAHVRAWLDACRGDLRCALVGYTGGFALIAACRRGPVWARPGVDGCRTPDVFMRRATRIRRALDRVGS